MRLRMQRLQARAATVLLSFCTGCFALERHALRGSDVLVPANTLSLAGANHTEVSAACIEALRMPVVNRTQDMPAVHNLLNLGGIARPVEERDSLELRRKALCYLKTVVDPCQVPSITRPAESLQMALAGQGRTCAVVSSSGIMSKTSAGSRIDEADVVMRFNNVTVKGFEKSVGSKESLRFVNMHFASKVLKGEFTADPNVFYVCALPTGNVSWTHWMQLAQARPDLRLFMVPTEMSKNVAAALRLLYDAPEYFHGPSKLPTTGAVGMLLAMSLCGKVDAYGMAVSDHAIQLGKQVPYHYDKIGGAATENAWHESFVPEKRLWRFLATDRDLIETQELAEVDVQGAACDSAPLLLDMSTE